MTQPEPPVPHVVTLGLGLAPTRLPRLVGSWGLEAAAACTWGLGGGFRGRRLERGTCTGLSPCPQPMPPESQEETKARSWGTSHVEVRGHSPPHSQRLATGATSTYDREPWARGAGARPCSLLSRSPSCGTGPGGFLSSPAGPGEGCAPGWVAGAVPVPGWAGPCWGWCPLPGRTAANVVITGSHL